MQQAYITIPLMLENNSGNLKCTKGHYNFFFIQGDTLQMHVSFRLLGDKTADDIASMKRLSELYNAQPGVSAEFNNFELKIKGANEIVGGISNDLLATNLVNRLERNLIMNNQEEVMKTISPQIQGYLGTRRDGTLPTTLKH